MPVNPIARRRQIFDLLHSMHISAHAAHSCFFLVMSVFPALVLLFALLRHTTLQPEDLLDFLSGLVPDALLPHIWSLLRSAFQSSTRQLISLSALAALWSAGRGIYALQEGLCVVYGSPRRRNWLLGRLLCAGYTVLFIVVLVLTLVLHVFGTTFLQFLQLRAGMKLWMGLTGLRYFLLVALQSLLFCAMYMYLTGVRRRFFESLPGALLSSLGWMSASSLFSLYVRYFPNYANIFGSVYAVALTGFWLYICISIFFYGAVLNRILRKNDDGSS